MDGTGKSDSDDAWRNEINSAGLATGTCVTHPQCARRNLDCCKTPKGCCLGVVNDPECCRTPPQVPDVNYIAKLASHDRVGHTPASNPNTTCEYSEGWTVRTCRECLNVVVRNRQCYLSPEGTCKDKAPEPGRKSDSRNPGAVNVPYFSSNETYCNLDDPFCHACHEAWERDVNVTLGFNVCTGLSGCVCTRICEANMKGLKFLQEQPLSGPRTPEPPRHALSSPWFVVPVMLVGILVPVIATVFFRRRRRNEGGNPSDVSSLEPPSPSERVPRISRHLDLFGWRALRHELIRKENELLAGAENVSPAVQYVDFTRMEPTAPDPDVDDATAPIAHETMLYASAPPEAASPSALPRLCIPTAPDFDDVASL